LLTRDTLKFMLLGNFPTLPKTKCVSLRDQAVNDKRGNFRYLIFLYSENGKVIHEDTWVVEIWLYSSINFGAR